MLNASYKFLTAAMVLTLGTVLLIGSGQYEKSMTTGKQSIQRTVSNGEVWEYAKDWYDGYNLHEYVKIKGKIGKNGDVIHFRDNATGLLVFRDVSKVEYDQVKTETTF